ncbi:hypothetical protein NUSPORA_00801 [Nucleospora cyclopteri]
MKKKKENGKNDYLKLKETFKPPKIKKLNSKEPYQNRTELEKIYLLLEQSHKTSTALNKIANLKSADLAPENATKLFERLLNMLFSNIKQNRLYFRALKKVYNYSERREEMLIKYTICLLKKNPQDTTFITNFVLKECKNVILNNKKILQEIIADKKLLENI